MMRRSKVIHLNTALPDEWAESQKGKLLDERHFNEDLLFGGEPVDVYKPNGEPLLLLRPGAIPLEVCERARSALRRAGKLGNELRGFQSATIGYYDQPTCRSTSFTANQVKEWIKVQPFIQACDRVFREELLPRYFNQYVKAYHTSPEWRIGRTAFTTMTVNLWNDDYAQRSDVHVDQGDLPEGFGVISVLRRGHYRGGYLVFPQYRVAVDLHTSDVLLCDVHEWHANAPIAGQPGWERIAVILYYRQEMIRCD